jgi:PIN domain nuclease of toxin-antitoxin system
VGYQQGLTPAFLLDTHVWVWTVEDDVRHLGRRTARLIERWAGQGALRVSPLSVFEIASLHGSGRLQLSQTPWQWIALAFENTRARLAPLPMEAALEAGGIGTAIVPDPIDRLLIGTARQSGATLVTADRRILGYAASRRDLRTHDARR